MDNLSLDPTLEWAPRVRLEHSCLTAERFIKKFEGGSQSALIACDDGGLHVLKMSSNPQGPNVLANEALGSILIRALGLSAPACRPVLLSEKFIRSNPGLSFQHVEERGLPPAGIHCAREFVPGYKRIFSRNPYEDVGNPYNKEAFLGIVIFDIWTLHLDSRQYLYRIQRKGKLPSPIFIDNGHLFGGPAWKRWRGFEWRPLFLDSTNFADRLAVDDWIVHFQIVIPAILKESIKQIPSTWHSGEIEPLVAWLLRRLDNLSRLVYAALD